MYSIPKFVHEEHARLKSIGVNINGEPEDITGNIIRYEKHPYVEGHVFARGLSDGKVGDYVTVNRIVFVLGMFRNHPPTAATAEFYGSDGSSLNLHIPD